MKEYFISPTPFIGSLIFPTLILGVLGIGSISTGDVVKMIGGAVCVLVLVVAYIWVIYQVRVPAVKISGDAVEVRGIFGGSRQLHARDCRLVISSNWVGFRREGHQDVMIDRGRFSKTTWRELEDDLRKLPVVGIV